LTQRGLTLDLSLPPVVSGAKMTLLSPEAIGRFHSDGFLKLPGFVPAEACDALIARAGELCERFDPAESISVFSTRDQARTSDAYFLGSGDKIRYFLEPSAVGPDGSLRGDPRSSLNKIGHALHDLDPVFERFSRAESLASVARDLGVTSPLLIQSMYIFKHRGIGGEVNCHQDATYLYTEPPTVLGLWFALEDATIENGCLWAIPGGHREGLRARFVRDENDAVRTITLDPTPFQNDRLVPLEAPKGTLIALHGLLPHMSHANTSPRSRHAYALHVIDAGAKYAPDNWLRRGPDMPLRGFN
jgi:phytanoyl-CoA hydroxylase